MTPPVYSTKFLDVQGLTGVRTLHAPAGFIVILRDLDAYSDPTISGADLFFIGSGGQTIWWNNFPVDQRSYGSWRGRQVINPGDPYYVRVDGDPCDVTISGYLLTAP